MRHDALKYQRHHFALHRYTGKRVVPGLLNELPMGKSSHSVTQPRDLDITVAIE